MNDLSTQLNKLWEIPESEREKGIKLLNKVYGNILSNPSNQKFRDLNFSKIRQKLDKCRPAFYLLFTAGFAQSVDGTRLQWQNNKITIKQLQDSNAALQATINGEDIDLTGEYGDIVDPEQTSIITNRTTNMLRAKKEKRQLEQAIDNTQNIADNKESNDNNDDVEVDDEEMRKALEMSMGDNDADNDNGNDVPMTDNGNDNENNTENENKTKKDNDMDVMSADDRAFIEQIRAAKGIKTTLKASDLTGLSAEEKKVKMKELRDKFRKEKQQGEMAAKRAKRIARRDGIKKNQEADRKRKAYELKMLGRQKQKEKEFAKKQHERVMAKIKAQKEERQRQIALKKKRTEAAKKAQQQ